MYVDTAREYETLCRDHIVPSIARVESYITLRNKRQIPRAVSQQPVAVYVNVGHGLLRVGFLEDRVVSFGMSSQQWDTE